jgi:hypothetical protein
MYYNSLDWTTRAKLKNRAKFEFVDQQSFAKTREIKESLHFLRMRTLFATFRRKSSFWTDQFTKNGRFCGRRIENAGRKKSTLFKASCL